MGLEVVRRRTASTPSRNQEEGSNTMTKTNRGHRTISCGVRFLILNVFLAAASPGALGAIVQIDATALSSSHFVIPGKTSALPSDVVQAVDLGPGTYAFNLGSALVNTFSFSVDAAGLIDYDPAFDGFLGGRGTQLLIVQGYTIQIDATALTSNAFALPHTFGLNTFPPMDSTVVQSITLAPASGHGFQASSGSVANFRWDLTIDGEVSFDPSLGGFLSGAGTSTLIVDGYAIQIDATDLSSTGFLLPNTFGLNSGIPIDSMVVQPLVLVPLQHYRFLATSNAVGNFSWEIGTDGFIDFDPSADAFLSGRGTDTLQLDGFTVNLDARNLSGTGFLLANTFGLRSGAGLDSTIVQSLTLIPLSGYRIHVGGNNVADLAWDIDLFGNIQFDSALDSFLSGRGTDSLEMQGFEIFIDATSVGSGVVKVFSILGLGPLSSTIVESLTLLPSIVPYQFDFNAVFRVPFDVDTNDGTLDYDISLDFCVAGRGTDHLIVLCDPGQPPSPEELIVALQSSIDAFPASVFRKDNLKLGNALNKKLDAVSAQLEAFRSETDSALRAQLKQEMLDKLNNDLAKKADGCAAIGNPENNDWIVDCGAQEDFLFHLGRLVQAVSSL